MACVHASSSFNKTGDANITEYHTTPSSRATASNPGEVLSIVRLALDRTRAPLPHKLHSIVYHSPPSRWLSPSRRRLCAQVKGMQHKYRETVLFFPTEAQYCHSFCTYCFRWAQFTAVGSSQQFASKDSQELKAYLRANMCVEDLSGRANHGITWTALACCVEWPYLGLFPSLSEPSFILTHA